ncbi:hypothetical protein [Bradyrhizobium embrapense]
MTTTTPHREWLDADGKRIQRPSRLVVSCAVYAAHLAAHAPGARADIGGAFTSLLEFRLALFRKRRLKNGSITPLLWMLSLLGDEATRSDLFTATEHSNKLDDIVADMIVAGLVTVDGDNVTMTEAGKRLCAACLPSEA